MSIDYQQFFLKIPSVCALLSPEFKILAVSDAFERASMRSRDEVIGSVIYEAFPDNPDDPSADGVSKLRSSLERVRHELRPDTMPIQRYDVEDPSNGVFAERYWSPVNTPVLDARGELQFIIHMSQEVTEVIQLQKRVREEHENLLESNVALAAANEELEAFCYSVAHDLRAPLRGIQGFSQALVEDYSQSIDEKGQQYLQRVANAALRMSELIDDLLTLSRISRAPLSRTRVDLSEIASTIAADLDRQSDRRLSVTIAPGLDATADAKLMQITFENLLGNAWKFTSKTESPRVEVGVATIDGARAFFVRDNGAGFDETYASKLFAPFQRLHSEKEFSGTGIGLATVQRIVRRHGGRVWARAAINSGATFYFTLPD